MKKQLRLYRQHTASCVHHYKKPIYEDQRDVPDCECPINAAGYLPNELDQSGKQKRILHRAVCLIGKVGVRSWTEARRIKGLWLEWEATRPPDIATQLRANPTVEQAVDYFLKNAVKEGAKGRNTIGKYEKLLRRRLVPWCNQQRNPIRLIAAFDDPITVRDFFHSWKKRKLGPKHVVLEVSTELANSTKRADLERYRSFLEFCKDLGWIKANHAKKISVGTSDVSPKFAFTTDEYENIVKTLDDWRDEHGRLGSPKAVMLRAFCLTLRYTGQRISDVSMLGPDNIVQENGKWFISLVQIKTGSLVKIPLPDDLRRTLATLPLRGELDQPFALKTSKRTIHYGAKFWFWTGDFKTGDPNEDSDERAFTHINYNCTQWSEDVSRVLRRCEQKFGTFKHHATAHTFRHFFALSMLRLGVSIEIVSKWLGHSTTQITAKHYWHANTDWHEASHEAYMTALKNQEHQDKARKKMKFVVVK